MTPQCPKLLFGDEYTWESLLPCDEYNRESQLPGLFGTSIRIGLQNKFLVPNAAGNHDSTVYSLQRSLDSLESLVLANVFSYQLGSTPPCIHH